MMESLASPGSLILNSNFSPESLWFVNHFTKFLCNIIPLSSPRHASRSYFPPFLAKGGKQDDYFSKRVVSITQE